MKIVWRARARADLVKLYDYIRADSLAGATRVRDQILHSVRLLADFPQIGRPSWRQGVRELVVPRTRYVVLFRPLPKAVNILRVIHQMRAR